MSIAVLAWTWIFKLIWRQRLRDYKLVRVTGWNTCLYDTRYGTRVRAEFVLGRQV